MCACGETDSCGEPGELCHCDINDSVWRSDEGYITHGPDLPVKAFCAGDTGEPLTLPYLTLPYGEDVIPPSAEASNGPNAHPRINRKVTKSPSAVLTWVHTKMWNHPLPNEGLLTR